jgi:hypothetical protein
MSPSIILRGAWLLRHTTTLHTFQGHYGNYDFVRSFQRVFARLIPFPRRTFVSSSYGTTLHLDSANVSLYARLPDK